MGERIQEAARRWVTVSADQESTRKMRCNDARSRRHFEIGEKSRNGKGHQDEAMKKEKIIIASRRVVQKTEYVETTSAAVHPPRNIRAGEWVKNTPSAVLS